MADFSGKNDDIFEGLNPKQCKFVEEYVKDSNGARAAREAGYRADKCTASRLLKSPEIKTAIEKARKLSSRAAAYNLENAMKELEELMDFSKRVQPLNIPKLLETKLKITGLLHDKLKLEFDKPMVSFNFNGMDTPAQIPQVRVIGTQMLEAARKEEEEDEPTS